VAILAPRLASCCYLRGGGLCTARLPLSPIRLAAFPVAPRSSLLRCCAAAVVTASLTRSAQVMLGWKVGSALGAGCTIVIKPSEFTPFSALEVAAAAEVRPPAAVERTI
jgi:hypothetical protein